MLQVEGCKFTGTSPATKLSTFNLQPTTSPLPAQIRDWQGRSGLLQHASAPVGAVVSTRSNEFMSQHRSLRAASTLGGKRNVLKRFERLEILRKAGEWQEGKRITGLRKTKPPV